MDILTLLAAKNYTDRVVSSIHPQQFTKKVSFDFADTSFIANLDSTVYPEFEEMIISVATTIGYTGSDLDGAIEYIEEHWETLSTGVKTAIATQTLYQLFVYSNDSKAQIIVGGSGSILNPVEYVFGTVGESPAITNVWCMIRNNDTTEAIDVMYGCINSSILSITVSDIE